MISNQDRRRISHAARVAQSSDCRFTHGAVLVSGGRVVGVAANRQRNDPTTISEPGSWTSHAEANALRAAGSRARNATIYIARVNTVGGLTMSKPCPDCTQRIVSAGISRVVYTTLEGSIVSERSMLTLQESVRQEGETCVSL